MNWLARQLVQLASYEVTVVARNPVRGPIALRWSRRRSQALQQAHIHLVERETQEYDAGGTANRSADLLDIARTRIGLRVGHRVRGR